MGTDFQDKAIMKEIKNVIVEFNKIDGVNPKRKTVVWNLWV